MKLGRALASLLFIVSLLIAQGQPLAALAEETAATPEASAGQPGGEQQQTGTGAGTATGDSTAGDPTTTDPPPSSTGEGAGSGTETGEGSGGTSSEQSGGTPNETGTPPETGGTPADAGTGTGSDPGAGNSAGIDAETGGDTGTGAVPPPVSAGSKDNAAGGGDPDKVIVEDPTLIGDPGAPEIVDESAEPDIPPAFDASKLKQQFDKDAGLELSEESDEPAEMTDLVVSTYDCDEDADGADDCDPFAGVTVDVSLVDGKSLGAFKTDVSGSVTVPVPVGSTVFVQELVPEGYTVFLGAGSAVVTDVPADGASVSFLNVPSGDPSEPSERSQVTLISVICPTLDEARTELHVLGMFRTAAAQDEQCQAGAADSFTLSGGEYDDGLALLTGLDGRWLGEVAADEYTVTHNASGQSVSGEALPGESFAVVAISRVPLQETGHLNLLSYRCQADRAAMRIVVGGASDGSGGAGNGAGASCAASEREVRINQATPFALGADGAMRMEMPVGTYVIYDTGSGVSAEFVIELDGDTNVAFFQDLARGGGTGGTGGGGNGGGGGGVVGGGGERPDQTGGAPVDTDDLEPAVSAPAAVEDDSDEAETVTQLPSTGTGDAATSDGGSELPSALSVLTLACAAIALRSLPANRRQPDRDAA